MSNIIKLRTYITFMKEFFVERESLLLAHRLHNKQQYLLDIYKTSKSNSTMIRSIVANIPNAQIIADWLIIFESLFSC